MAKGETIQAVVKVSRSGVGFAKSSFLPLGGESQLTKLALTALRSPRDRTEGVRGGGGLEAGEGGGWRHNHEREQKHPTPDDSMGRKSMKNDAQPFTGGPTDNHRKP